MIINKNYFSDSLNNERTYSLVTRKVALPRETIKQSEADSFSMRNKQSQTITNKTKDNKLLWLGGIGTLLLGTAFFVLVGLPSFKNHSSKVGSTAQKTVEDLVKPLSNKLQEIEESLEKTGASISQEILDELNHKINALPNREEAKPLQQRLTVLQEKRNNSFPPPPPPAEPPKLPIENEVPNHHATVPTENELPKPIGEPPPIVRREASAFPKDLNIPLLVEDTTNPLPKKPFERAKEALARRYEAIVKLPIEQRNYKNTRMTPAHVDTIRNYEETGMPAADTLVYRKFIQQIYNELRLHPYLETETMGFEPDIAEKTVKHIYYTEAEFSNANIPFIEASEKIAVLDFGDGWHRRRFLDPPGGKRTRTTKGLEMNTGERLSVNAVGCQGLIDALDAVFTTHGIFGDYKVPSTAKRWHNRHDPVTIYLDEKATPEVLALIESAVKPYIRSTKDVMPGRIIIPGLVLETIPTSTEGSALIQKANSFNPALGNALSDFLDDGEEGAMSSGMLKAAELALDFFSPAVSS
jgi:hypothetical protein